MLRGELGYADGYGGKPLPFFKNFYAGGVGSVRGYETSSLGPQDIYGNASAASARSSATPSCFCPTSRATSRCALSVFVDAGQIYGNGKSSERQRSTCRFRYSAGVGARVELAGGAAQVQLRLPLNDKPRDKIQRFQFQVGTMF